MPVPAGAQEFVQFRYAPTYLRGAEHLRTPNGFCLLGLTGVRRSPLVVDGGNVVRRGGTAILTDRVYADNPSLSPEAVRARLREDLVVDRVIVIPAEPGDVLGHADGVLRLLDERTVLVSDYRHVDPAYGRRIGNRLRRRGLDIILCPYAPTNGVGNDGMPSAAGIYVNFLQTPDVIACPVYGQRQDDLALRTIGRCFGDCRVAPVRCDGPAAEGGSLHCLTWEAGCGGEAGRTNACAVQAGMCVQKRAM